MILAKQLIFRYLTKTDFKAMNDLIQSQGGGSQTYIDLPKNQISDADLTSFLGQGSPASYGFTWSVDVHSLSLGSNTQTITISARRDATNSIREQNGAKRIEILKKSVSGFPDTTYNDANDPICLFIIKDITGAFWAGWFSKSERKPGWYIPLELIQVMTGKSGDCGFVDLSLPISIDISDFKWPFRYSSFIQIPSNGTFKKYIDILIENHNMILTGAPGTGKTHLAKAIAAQMGAETQFVQFHPSYDYTDFVEGLRPTLRDDNSQNSNTTVAFERRDGIFKSFCKEALSQLKKESEAATQGDEAQQTNKPYVFIIDEINRGELSKIFGELFFAIEPGYRGEKGRVSTQYQGLITDKDDPFKDGFYVPSNVYIIGTMNDIDRSVESMDFAIRRRFVWEEITAEQSADNMGIKGLARKKMDALNAALKKEDLSEAFFVGGAYFREVIDGELDNLWSLRLKGIVSEYFRGMPDMSDKVERVRTAYMGANLEAPAEGTSTESE